MMTTRRRFLQASAIVAMPASMHDLTASAEPAASVPMPYHAVVARTHSIVNSFAENFATRGTTVHALADDEITGLWLGTIRPMWERGPATIAGLTGPATLFCLEQLAWSHGLRVVFHAEHVIHADGSTVHQLQRGGASAGIGAADLARAGPAWPAQLAQAMATYRRNQWEPRFGPSLAALEPALPSGAQLLASWIIAAA